MAAQIAQCGDSGGIVLYRHSVTGVSKFANLGDELPSNDGVGGRWEALASYNVDESETLPSFITVVDGNSGPILRFDANLFAEVGVKINLRGGSAIVASLRAVCFVSDKWNGDTAEMTVIRMSLYPTLGPSTQPN